MEAARGGGGWWWLCRAPGKSTEKDGGKKKLVSLHLLDPDRDGRVTFINVAITSPR